MKNVAVESTSVCTAWSINYSPPCFQKTLQRLQPTLCFTLEDPTHDRLHQKRQTTWLALEIVAIGDSSPLVIKAILANW